MPEICAKLMDAGRDGEEPVAVVSSATLPDMRVLETSLANAAIDVDKAGMGPPSIICIGKIALMRQCLDWMSALDGTPQRSLDPLGVGLISETG